MRLTSSAARIELSEVTTAIMEKMPVSSACPDREYLCFFFDFVFLFIYNTVSALCSPGADPIGGRRGGGGTNREKIFSQPVDEQVGGALDFCLKKVKINVTILLLYHVEH